MKVLNEDLMESMLKKENLQRAWKSVKSNNGKPGIDHISVEEFKDHIFPHWDKLVSKITNGSYKPSPVRRVYIPKERGEKRPLGIPTVQDRFLQQAALQVIQPLFDSGFSDHSYGFRPGRSAHDAVKAAQNFVKEGKDWVVDIDLKSFFDEVNQDLLMYKVSKTISDKRMLKFIGKYLRAGVLDGGKVKKSIKGVPQGSPLSPLLANIYLDSLDKELESRNLSFCRYADDCNIYVRSQKAANRIFLSISKWIEKNLKIPVNKDKSDTGRPWERQFLGYQITKALNLTPSPKALSRFKIRVRKMFEVRLSQTSTELRDNWKQFIRGWCNYYRLSKVKTWRVLISGWIRRHMRKYFWLRWHGSKGRLRNLKKLGAKDWQIKRCSLHGSAWPMAKHPAMNQALDNKTLRRYGFLVPLDFVVS